MSALDPSETPRIESWTRTLNEDDALTLVDLARAGLPLSAWTEDAHDALPQASRDRRTETIRLVREHLLDWVAADADDPAIADTTWLRLMHDGAPYARVELLWGRYLFEHPWVRRAIDELVAPALAAADEPLSPRDVDRLDLTDWTTWVDRTLRPDVGPASRPKTRQQLQRALVRLGVLDIEDARAGLTRVRHARPAPVVFGWLVAHEMRLGHRIEMDLDHATCASRTARLLLPDPIYARQCLDDAVARGILRRGYLAGRARLHPGEP